MPSFARRVVSCAAKFQLCAVTIVVVALVFACATIAYAQGNDEQLYTEAFAREATLRKEIDTRKAGAPALPLLGRARVLVRTYDDIARLFPRSAYSDNALWQAGMLAADSFWEFGEAADRATALRLLNAIPTRYPSSSRAKDVLAHVSRLAAAAPGTEARPVAKTTAAAPAPAPAVAAGPVTTLKAIRREVMPGVLRVTLELEREATFHDERLSGPPRVFIDLQNTRSVDALKDATLAYPDDVVRQIRVGRQLGTRTRVVLDLEGAARHSVYTLYNPYRVVIDFERPGGPPLPARDGKTVVASKGTETGSTTKDTKDTKVPQSAAVAPPSARPIAPPSVSPIAPTSVSSVAPTSAPPVAPTSADVAAIVEAGTLPASTSAASPAGVGPVAPASPTTARRNTDGTLSLSRQLGLGIARIVIDPGHGGHDPGAKARGAMSEAELVLDIALRLEKLLLKQPGVEVVMTRRTNDYVPLEERTAIANRESADLFLSIHANASEDARARGVETYFLNFASNKQAEAIAARENAGSARTMGNLPDIVRAIALNNKLDESRDFASLVQSAMVERLKRANRASRNLGVKQAPFMVLIGATMPSVLAEISFVTNKQEATWLKTQTYRQQLAEALLNGIMRYQKSLKGTQIAAQ